MNIFIKVFKLILTSAKHQAIRQRIQEASDSIDYLAMELAFKTQKITTDLAKDSSVDLSLTAKYDGAKYS